MFYDENDPQSLEKYSSAVSLSDMEIYIFPELMYALTLANIMSPKIWQWREDTWFKNLEKMNDTQRVKRMKQFIMDKFVFNLDLDTWGLTTKEKELDRFKDFVDLEMLSKSNALFGYEGDKYYFDIDIRRHFGLEKYTDETIPYWKTETLEAMEAFKYKEEYQTGAGECVSLATLYAATVFIVAQIDLEKIQLMATPLHSQNFVDLDEGLVTNNRRVVTKAMWFNGTELSDKAQRALRNEKVTMIVNNKGYVHTMYDDATMPMEEYKKIASKMTDFLKMDVNFYTLCSFLRKHENLQQYFQFPINRFGKMHYIEAEKAYRYEHSLASRAGTESHKALFNKIEIDEFYEHPIEDRIDMGILEKVLKKHRNKDSFVIAEELCCHLKHADFDVCEILEALFSFCEIKPNLPKTNKNWIQTAPIEITTDMDRHDIMQYLESIRETHPIADLAFMAYRDMNKAPWKPFIKAALERNPVTYEKHSDSSIADFYTMLSGYCCESIYDGARMAQPDEVVNFKRGDGLEKAITFINFINQCEEENSDVAISYEGKTIIVSHKDTNYTFTTFKDVKLPTQEDFDPFLG